MGADKEALSNPDLAERIAAFVRRASTEVTAHDENTVAMLSQTLPNGSTVYVAHTPKASFDDVIRVAIKVQASGLRASPHLVARRLPGERTLREGLLRMRAAGVEQALLVAGDCSAPLGPFSSSLDVISSGALADAGLRCLGVAGHPEGLTGVESARLWRALKTKQDFADRAGIAMHVVTQLGFNPDAIHDWAERFDAEGLSIPVHVGLAGPASISKLLRFAALCGVGPSMRAASRNVRGVAQAAGLTTSPEDMVAALVRLGAGDASARIVRPHFFTFGAAAATSQWIRDIAEGAFPPERKGARLLGN